MIDKMLIRGAKVHNLKNIDVDIPLGKIVGLASLPRSAVHLHAPPHDAGVQGERG